MFSPVALTAHLFVGRTLRSLTGCLRSNSSLILSLGSGFPPVDSLCAYHVVLYAFHGHRPFMRGRGETKQSVPSLRPCKQSLSWQHSIIRGSLLDWFHRPCLPFWSYSYLPFTVENLHCTKLFHTRSIISLLSLSIYLDHLIGYYLHGFVPVYIHPSILSNPHRARIAWQQCMYFRTSSYSNLLPLFDHLPSPSSLLIRYLRSNPTPFLCFPSPSSTEVYATMPVDSRWRKNVPDRVFRHGDSHATGESSSLIVQNYL